MNGEILQIAARIKDLREVLEIPAAEMAEVTGLSAEEYLRYETGQTDFSFTFLFKVSRRFGVDITDLLTGESTRLSSYSIVRSAKGLPIARREGFAYQNMAYLFKDKISEPFIVTAPYAAENETAVIPVATHHGQEFDYVLEGKLRFWINGKEEMLGEGDLIYYDSSREHGMLAVGGKPCKFLAVVMSSDR